MSFLDGLNEAQKTAVCLGDEPALILAGAGSGKTRVLIARIAHLISTGRARPHHILAVTFTNKAAHEMRARLKTFMGHEPAGLWMGTFHALCHRFLRIHAEEAGLPSDFQIMDMADQRAFLKRILKEAQIDEKKHPVPALQRFINQQKESGLRAGEVEVHRPDEKAHASLYALYESACQKEGRVDFGELVLRCHALFEANSTIRNRYRERFRHILVDEFQDTNRLQYAWLKTLAGLPPAPFSSLPFCVGDDDQSIYRFRGAHVGNMHAFREEYRVSALIRLEQNYRSAGRILEAANAIIRNNPDRLGKNLWTEAAQGPLLQVFEALDENDEAMAIVTALKKYRDSGIPLSEMAVLYRANAQSQAIEHRLFAAGLPYRVHGGLRFFDRQEIRHALAYLRLLASPDDNSAFLRVVNFPPRGIGARSLAQLESQAQEQNSSLYESARYAKGRTGQALHNFVGWMDALRAQTTACDLCETLSALLHASGLLAHYQADEQAEERVANLYELVNAAKTFLFERAVDGVLVDDPLLLEAAPPPLSDLQAFLAHAALESAQQDVGEGDDRIQLMTVHAAKGLEFEVVWICGLEDGLFPHQNSLFQEGGLEEERRLMYVAITRAKKQLHLSSAQHRLVYGQKTPCERSRFLEEIPSDLVSQIQSRSAYPHIKKLASMESRSGFSRSSLSSGYSSAISGLTSPSETQPLNQQESEALSTGQAIFHAHFGEGVIVGFQGSGSECEILIRFRRDGQKWLLLSAVQAKLVRI
jgi:DNA helicase II / ATP-dependent DNA helicase PcrA